MNNIALKLNGAASDKERRSGDFYPTPPEVTIALLDFLKLPPMTVWEPACGDNAIVDVLLKRGHRVIATDISKGHDYFYTQHACDAIITNPPFNLAEEFIKKALKESDIVCMLLKSQYWHAVKRYKLFNSQPPTFVLPLTWRPNFFFRDRINGTPVMEFAWSVWVKGDLITKYIPLLKPLKEKEEGK